MILLFIIADDFTGALDTGVLFAARGIRTRVVVGTEVDFAATKAEVLVVDTETRHLSAKEAYDIVARLTAEARAAGVAYIYKKTDSALRGNIGAELTAVLDAGKRRQLFFLPAFPQTGRTTEGGVHFVDGVPVQDSPFGADPFEPVRHSLVTQLIAEQSQVLATSFPALGPDDPVPQTDGILVFDAKTNGDLLSTGLRLKSSNALHIMAGCAGFGEVLPTLLGIASQTPPKIPKLDPRLLVVCGSVNPITVSQLEAAEKAGFAHIRLTPEEKLTAGHWSTPKGQEKLAWIRQVLADNPLCMINANDVGDNQPTKSYATGRGIEMESIRLAVSRSIGYLVDALFASPALGTLFITGGDTLLQCMDQAGVNELEPVGELEKGVVLSRFIDHGVNRYLISKSGGFGGETLLIDLAEKLKENHFMQV